MIIDGAFVLLIIDVAFYRGVRRQQQAMLSLEEAAAGRGRNGFVWVGLFEPDLAELATGHLRPEMPPRPGQPDIHGGHRIPVGVRGSDLL